MPELPDLGNVIGGEVVSSDWGNDIRDRTIQRYANTAERSTEHPTPSVGDLSFLEDTGLVYVYYGGSWKFPAGHEIGASTNTIITSPLTTGESSVATVDVPIPSYWDEWSCTAQASWTYSSTTGTVATFKMRIDGTDGPDFSLETSNQILSGSWGFRRTGITTTGDRTIALRGLRTTNPVTINKLWLLARALRTA